MPSGRIERIAQERFGFESFRPGQREAVRSILAGRDTLAVMPTGSGKSAIYRIAGMLIDGPTVVISPLIALQQDQVENIEEQGTGGAAQVNSTVREGYRREALEDLEEGDLEFLFIAPEQFNDEKTIDQLREAEPSLFVVDEAHCISEWGHDFRPAYLRLGAVIEALGHPRVLALTATASPLVRGLIGRTSGLASRRSGTKLRRGGPSWTASRRPRSRVSSTPRRGGAPRRSSRRSWGAA